MQNLNLRCPGCFLESGKCFWRDVGGIERFIDEYTFTCDICGYVEKIENYGGCECGEEIVTYCKYCGEVFWKHHHPPKNLLFLI